jgi:hypothetical protein
MARRRDDAGSSSRGRQVVMVMVVGGEWRGACLAVALLRQQELLKPFIALCPLGALCSRTPYSVRDACTRAQLREIVRRAESRAAVAHY